MMFDFCYSPLMFDFVDDLKKLRYLNVIVFCQSLYVFLIGQKFLKNFFYIVVDILNYILIIYKVYRFNF